MEIQGVDILERENMDRKEQLEVWNKMFRTIGNWIRFFLHKLQPMEE